MPSDNKTPNFGLNQWKGNEYPKREDFVEDNSIIDTEIKVAQDKVQNVTIGADNKPAYEYLTVGTRGAGVVGSNSFTSGTDIIASGADSQAEGLLTKATADQSHAEGQGTKASGNAAHSEGRGTTASGDYSHVEGENNAAIGRGSHAEGGATRAVLNYAHSEGYLTAAIAPNSHAEGTAACALESSHAEGVLTFAGYGTLYKITAINNINKTITLENVTGLAVGDKLQILREDHQSTVIYDVPISAISGLVVTLSTPVTIISAWKYVVKTLVGGYPAHAEGRLTKAIGYDSHAEGQNTIASGPASHAEGANTIASGNASHAEGYTTIASGNNSHAEGTTTIASGANSHTEGMYSKTIGDHSHSEGYNNVSQGIASHTEGARNVAVNVVAHAEGDGCWAGQTAHAEGYGTIAGVGATYKITAFNNTAKTVTLDHVTYLAVGSALQVRRIPSSDTLLYNIPITAISGLVVTLNTTATIDSTWAHMILISDSLPAHAEGYATMALGAYSHVEGYDTFAAAVSSHAEGSGTKATGLSSHAEGGGSIAIGIAAHAEGTNTIASVDYTHAEGINTKASGQASHSEGDGTESIGYASHAGGTLAIARGVRSFAHGYGIEAAGNEQTVFGRYNIADASALLVIGNGTSNAARHNAFAVLADGTVRSDGHVYSSYSSTNVTMAGGFSMLETCATDRSGYHTELQLYLSGSIPANTWTTIATIPNAIDRPARVIRGVCFGNSTIGQYAITPAGVITVLFSTAQTAMGLHVGYLAPII